MLVREQYQQHKKKDRNEGEWATGVATFHWNGNAWRVGWERRF